MLDLRIKKTEKKETDSEVSFNSDTLKNHNRIENSSEPKHKSSGEAFALTSSDTGNSQDQRFFIQIFR